MLVPIHLAECAAVISKVRSDKPELVVFVVPHLPSAVWFQSLEKSAALWIQLPGRDDDLVDSRGCAVGRLCIDLWLVLM